MPVFLPTVYQLGDAAAIALAVAGAAGALGAIAIPAAEGSVEHKGSPSDTVYMQIGAAVGTVVVGAALAYAEPVGIVWYLGAMVLLIECLQCMNGFGEPDDGEGFRKSQAEFRDTVATTLLNATPDPFYWSGDAADEYAARNDELRVRILDEMAHADEQMAGILHNQAKIVATVRQGLAGVQIALIGAIPVAWAFVAAYHAAMGMAWTGAGAAAAVAILEAANSFGDVIGMVACATALGLVFTLTGEAGTNMGHVHNTSHNHYVDGVTHPCNRYSPTPAPVINVPDDSGTVDPDIPDLPTVDPVIDDKTTDGADAGTDTGGGHNPFSGITINTAAITDAATKASAKAQAMSTQATAFSQQVSPYMNMFNQGSQQVNQLTSQIQQAAQQSNQAQPADHSKPDATLADATAPDDAATEDKDGTDAEGKDDKDKEDKRTDGAILAGDVNGAASGADMGAPSLSGMPIDLAAEVSFDQPLEASLAQRMGFF